jgi:malonate transporter
MDHNRHFDKCRLIFMDSAADILGITGPIYLAIALGYFTTRRGLFSPGDMQVLGRFTLHIALPALLFNALSRTGVAESINEQYLAAYALGTLGMVLAAWVWARHGCRHPRGLSAVLAMGMSCPNSAFVGYPVIMLTLGSSAAGIALALNMVVENLLIIPLLMALAGGDGSGGWRHALRQSLSGLLKNPIIQGITGGILFSLSGLHMPDALGRSIDLFAAASGALSLFVIGGSLVGLQLQGLKSAIAIVAVGKLLLHPILMLMVLWWCVPVDDPALRTAALLTAALPMMGIYTLLAQRLGHGSIGAAAQLVTTGLSFLSLTAVLGLLSVVPF